MFKSTNFAALEDQSLQTLNTEIVNENIKTCSEELEFICVELWLQCFTVPQKYTMYQE